MANSALGVTLRQIQRLYDGEAVASLPDTRLLERFAVSCDEASFEALVARHGPMVLGVCRSVLKDEHDAEDAFQATFLTLARKARSIRVENSLGGWLYRVAYRVAVQANLEADRRRLREIKAGSRVAEAFDFGRESRRSDDLATLHEEIERLPDQQRAPVVLCYLEGMTYEEAARSLCWTEPALRSRLTKARERLKGRLTRRGITGAVAIVGAFSSSEPAALAAVPYALLRGAVEVASRRATASASAVLLAGRLRWAWNLSRLKVALPALALACAASFAIANGGDKPPTETPKPAPKPAPAFAPARPAAEKPVETIEVRGGVLDPDGKPVAGATVRLAYFVGFIVKRDDEPITTSGADGRFSLQAPRDIVEQLATGRRKYAPELVATAPGFGPGRAQIGNYSGPIKDVVVRLVKDDVPIEGRILDLEGKPVAGAVILTSQLFEAPAGDLTPWIEGMKLDPTGPHDGGLIEMPFREERTTGPDGRFRLDGVGRERIVMFTVSGPTIAVTRTFAMTKDVPPLQSSNVRIVGPRTMIFHGARFDFAAAPCKVVTGVVRDFDSGEPLAGIHVSGMEDRHNTSHYREVQSTTDDRGRYRLVGLPSADRYRIFASAEGTQPYLSVTFFEPSNSKGMAPATIDLRLKRGVLVRGRAVDKLSKLPLKDVRIASYALQSNPHVKDYPGFRHSRYPASAYTDSDGRFAIAALPGPGFLGARASPDHYLLGVGKELIQPEDTNTSLPAYPAFPFANDFNLLVPFDFKAGDPQASLELQLDPGRTGSATIVDPEGKPVVGCIVYGREPYRFWARSPLDTATFEAMGLDPRKPRLVMASHEGRKLSGWALITADGNGPATLPLRPTATITGRIVDEEGQPRTRLEIAGYGASERPDPLVGSFQTPLAVDQHGRFRIELVPGAIFTASAVGRNGGTQGELFANIKLEPGEVRDLGDIVVKPLK